MDKSLLFVTLPIMAVAALALVRGISLLRAAPRTGELAVLPLAGVGAVDILEAGDMVLSLRGTLGSRDFAKASFTLRDAAGKPVPSSMIVVRSVRTGLDGETTLSVRRFAVPVAGRYQLETTGIDPERIADNSRLVLSKPGGGGLVLRVLWVVAAAVALLASLAFSAVVVFAQPVPATVSVPAAGSPARAAILNAVRDALAIPSTGQSRFKVFHLKTAGPWAYFEGNEIVRVEGREWQETDMTVKALLQQDNGAWRARALWSLPGNERASLQAFERRVKALRERSRIPAAIFP